MTTSAMLAMLSAQQHGATHTFTRYIHEDTPTRGAGYWRWMPELVVSMIGQGINDGADYVIYLDAGVEVLRSINHITDRMKPDDHVWLFGNEHNHVEWCKGDCLKAMQWQGKDTDKQVQASVHVWRCTPEALEIATNWSAWCEVDHMIDDSPSIEPNHPLFKEHRHPQAVLTNIAYKHGIPLHWWPTEYGHYIKHRYKDNYPQLFNHHRKRNTGTNEPQQPEWTMYEQGQIARRYADRNSK